MTHIKTRIAAIAVVASASLGFMAMPASAHGGLVDVHVEDNDILNDLNLSVPVTVQVPIGIAANVCGVDVNAAVLAEQLVRDGSAECDAESTSRAFANLVNRQVN